MWRALACLSVLAAALVEMAAPAPADAQPAQATIVGVVVGDSACPSAQTAAQPAEFRAGQTVTVCFAAGVAGSGTTDIVVGQMHAPVGQIRDNSLEAALPDQASAGTYPLSGTFNGTPIAPTLIRFYPTTRPRITDVSPQTVNPGTDVRINGEGLAAPT